MNFSMESCAKDVCPLQLSFFASKSRLQYLSGHYHLHFFLCTDKEATVRKSSNNTILRVADIAGGDKKIFDTLGY